jgi:hypothetical protein
MNTQTDIRSTSPHAPAARYARLFVCAFAAFALTFILLGEISNSPAQAAQSAAQA